MAFECTCLDHYLYFWIKTHLNVANVAVKVIFACYGDLNQPIIRYPREAG